MQVEKVHTNYKGSGTIYLSKVFQAGTETVDAVLRSSNNNNNRFAHYLMVLVAIDLHDVAIIFINDVRAYDGMTKDFEVQRFYHADLAGKLNI